MHLQGLLQLAPQVFDGPIFVCDLVAEGLQCVLTRTRLHNFCHSLQVEFPHLHDVRFGSVFIWP